MFSRFTGLEKREMLNAWFILLVTSSERAGASTAFVLGWVQLLLTSACGQYFPGQTLLEGCVCVCAKEPPAGCMING